MGEGYVAHDLIEFFAWLSVPQCVEDLRRIEMDIPGVDVADLRPFLSCDRWNYSVETVSFSEEEHDHWTLVLKTEKPVPDDQIEAVQERFEAAANAIVLIQENAIQDAVLHHQIEIEKNVL